MDKELQFSAWEELKVGGTPPAKRYGHACVMLGRRMYTFGGASSTDDETLYYDDLFMLDFGESTLTWRAVDQHGERPSAREGTTLNSLNTDLYLYGGVDKEGTFTCAEGLFLFKTTSSTWAKCQTEGEAPKAQSLSAVMVDKKLITFGGVLEGKPMNDTHQLNTETMEWTQLKTSGTPPSPRCDHACCVVGSRLFVTAGSGGESVWFNDVFSLDVSSGVWSPVNVQGAPPTPRDYTTLCAVSMAYLVGFGGFTGCRDDEECLSELCYIDLAEQKLSWYRMAAESPSPSPRYGHSMVVNDNELILFAGQDVETEFNDVWSISLKLPMLDYEPTPVPRAQYSTATPIPAPRRTVKAPPPQEVKPRDFEELRTTYVKRINEMFDTLSERFLQLDNAIAKLSSERSAFEEEKKSHHEVYEKQQQELKDLLESHETQNEEFLHKIQSENDKERQRLAEQRASLERANAELAKEKELFQSKSTKLDAIMKQVQGLQ